MRTDPLVTEEVQDALDDGRPVVALETTLISHGFPGGEGVQVALASEARVRDAGAVPATIGIVDGALRVGLAESDLKRFASAGDAARKVGARDLAACLVQGALGATTVGGTLAVCRLAGIRFMATGGTGGVHRGFATVPDVPCTVAAVPEAEELGMTSAYYVAGAIDGSRPGTYYLNTSEPESRHRYVAEDIAFHEAVPGHHFQLTIAMESKDLAPARQRLAEHGHQDLRGQLELRLPDSAHAAGENHDLHAGELAPASSHDPLALLDLSYQHNRLVARGQSRRGLLHDGLN